MLWTSGCKPSPSTGSFDFPQKQFVGFALANATEFGLISYVYSSDLKRAIKTAEAIESGMVAINRGVISDPAAPFGGFKQSGLGREGGFHGIHEFLETKYIGVEI